ncbi:TonB-dependent receptor [Flavivirga amylovorans]|uniref:TonB-dependent receptor n=1 Tax=Flavivirga amylovorans TaxID=870486 RepID=A0ABT8WX18_9FLAO|nr:TonB-dependent receptor [Flavivirga amylovorans]MDO5986231.1 TonB-dependent receptor [Flavivirga amylovorans]
MKYRLVFFLSSFMFLGQIILAQNIKVSGKIIDEAGLPLVGTTIITANTGNGIKGAVADFDGYYTITVDTKGKLIFSYIGYITQEIDVNGRTEINVSLLPDTESLDEVVVVGYNKIKKANVVGSVASVKGEAIRETGLTNVSQAIQDRLPGVYTEIPSGQPGVDDANITIRGVSSYSDVEGANAPLILIDGVEATGGFSQIDPSEIAQISVLKDAASAAVYGVRGANGVIIITTRRGRIGKPRISTGFNITAKTISDVPQKLGSYETLMLGQEAIKNDGAYSSLRPQRFIDNFLDPNRDQIKYPDIDWYDALIRDIGWEYNARVNVSGGTKFVKYFSSISFIHLGDILKTEDFNGYYDPEFNYDKVNFRTNLDFDLSKSTKLAINISGRSDLVKTPDTNLASDDFANIFRFINIATPYLFPLYYPKDFVEANPDPNSPYPSDRRLADASAENPFMANPYSTLNYSGMRKTRTDVVDFQVGLTQNLDAITKGLSVSTRFNYSTTYKYRKEERYRPHLWFYDALAEEWRPQSGQNYNTLNPDFRSTGGEDFRSIARNTYYEFKINYDRKFGEHNVAALGVFNRYEYERSIAGIPDKGEEWAGLLNYDYKEKYLLSLTAGYNGTAKFARGKSFGFFPGFSLGWDLAKEKIIKDNLPWLDVFKARFSYGETGTTKGINVDDFLYLSGWNQTSINFGYNRFGLPIRNEVERWAEVKLGNPNATWNTVIKRNLGFDAQLFKRELSLGLDFYNEYRSGILIKLPVISLYHPSIGNRPDGKVEVPSLNLGETKNHGIEISANYQHVTPSGLQYSFGGFATIPDSRIVIAEDRALTPDYRRQQGKPIGWLAGLYSNGYINNFEEAINSPQFGSVRQPGRYSYADFNGDGIIDRNNDNVAIEGTSQPLITYAFNAGIKYKGFDFSVRFFGKDGVSYLSNNIFPTFNGSLLEAKTIHLDRWSPENQNAAFPAFGHVSSNQDYATPSNKRVVDGSYLKLQNVRLAYNLQSEFLKKAFKITKMNFNLTGQNLYTWSNVPFGEPEGGNGSSQGQYPIVKRFVFGVNIDF